MPPSATSAIGETLTVGTRSSSETVTATSGAPVTPGYPVTRCVTVSDSSSTSASSTGDTVTLCGSFQFDASKVSAPETVAAPGSPEAGVTVTAVPGSVPSTTP